MERKKERKERGRKRKKRKKEKEKEGKINLFSFLGKTTSALGVTSIPLFIFDGIGGVFNIFDLLFIFVVVVVFVILLLLFVVVFVVVVLFLLSEGPEPLTRL